MSPIAYRLETLGISLPIPPQPVGAYVPVVRSGALLFVSGQIPLRDGQARYRGRLGAELTVEDGQQAARLCAINILAHVNVALDGELERVRRVVHLRGYVNAVPGFGQEPQVLNGASELMVEVFRDAGRHARAAVGVASLPLNVGVEVEAVFEIGEA